MKNCRSQQMVRSSEGVESFILRIFSKFCIQFTNVGQNKGLQPLVTAVGAIFEKGPKRRKQNENTKTRQ
jgi:hypothetical protein